MSRGRYVIVYIALLVVVGIVVVLLGAPAWILVTMAGGMAFYMGVAPTVFHALGPRLGAGLMASVLVTGAATDFLKDLLDMPRPPRDHWLVEAWGPGFPSGHASVSTSFWAFIALSTPSPYTGVAAVYAPAMIGASRVELGVHYPVDVAGGLLLGLAVALAARAAVAFLSPLQVAGVASVVSVALEALSMGRVEIPSASLGVLAGLLAYERLAGGFDYRAGWRLGLSGSLAALAFGGPALLVESRALTAVLVFLAGFSGVVAPLAVSLAGRKLLATQAGDGRV